MATPRGVAAQHGVEQAEKCTGEVEGGVQEQMGFDPGVGSQPPDQFPAQGGLAGAHIAHDHIQAALQAQGQFQLLQAGDMLPGFEKAVRVRCVGERFPF